MGPESIADEVARIYQERGHWHYGEGVSERAHALQAAALARQAGEPDELVAASLLHDIGHLLHGLGEDIADHGIDAAHEEWSARALLAWFGPRVAEPARLHVAAKRYLCAVDPTYAEGLSDASRRSLALQGGPMREAEVIAFESHPHHAAAVRLRRYDDGAKVPGLEVPDLDAYRPLLVRLARAWATRTAEIPADQPPG